jgi:hypothetical protein
MVPYCERRTYFKYLQTVTLRLGNPVLLLELDFLLGLQQILISLPGTSIVCSKWGNLGKPSASHENNNSPK